jgi:hypothetical protein
MLWLGLHWRKFAGCLKTKPMNRLLIQSAKQIIPQIVEQSAQLEKSEILVLHETPNGCTLAKLTELKTWIDQDGRAVDPSSFIFLGSVPLKTRDVKRIIEDCEYFEYND